MPVASVARFVSVFVGADVSVTWMFGYCFSNALISTCRTSVPLLLIGLAHQLIVPVADPRCRRRRRWRTAAAAAAAAAGHAERRGHPGQGGQPPASEPELCRVFWVILACHEVLLLRVVVF